MCTLTDHWPSACLTACSLFRLGAGWPFTFTASQNRGELALQHLRLTHSTPQMIPQSLKHSRSSLLLFSHDSGLPQVTLSGRYCGLGTALQVSHSPPPPPRPTSTSAPQLRLHRRPWSARAALRPDTSPATDGSNSEIGLMPNPCSRPAPEKSDESVEEISAPGNLSRISRNPRKSETYRIRDRPLKKAEALGGSGDEVSI